MNKCILDDSNEATDNSGFRRERRRASRFKAEFQSDVSCKHA